MKNLLVLFTMIISANTYAKDKVLLICDSGLVEEHNVKIFYRDGALKGSFFDNDTELLMDCEPKRSPLNPIHRVIYSCEGLEEGRLGTFEVISHGRSLIMTGEMKELYEYSNTIYTDSTFDCRYNTVR